VVCCCVGCSFIFWCFFLFFFFFVVRTVLPEPHRALPFYPSAGTSPLNPPFFPIFPASVLPRPRDPHTEWNSPQDHPRHPPFPATSRPSLPGVACLTPLFGGSARFRAPYCSDARDPPVPPHSFPWPSCSSLTPFCVSRFSRNRSSPR